jgi:hypothetical protein
MADLSSLFVVVERSLTKLLAVVKEKGYLASPHGRRTIPSPLITEDEFLLKFMSSETVLSNDALTANFEFEYGFNALKFLSKQIRCAHSDSIQKSKLDRLKVFTRLQERACHALLQLNTFQSLNHICLRQGSGVLWGPIISLVDECSVTCMFRTLGIGTFLIEISTDKDFMNIVKLVTENAVDGSKVIKILVDELTPNTRYFVRCSEENVNSFSNDDVISNEETNNVPSNACNADVSVANETINDDGIDQNENDSGTKAVTWKNHHNNKKYFQSRSFWTPPDVNNYSNTDSNTNEDETMVPDKGNALESTYDDGKNNQEEDVIVTEVSSKVNFTEVEISYVIVDTQRCINQSHKKVAAYNMTDKDVNNFFHTTVLIGDPLLGSNENSSCSDWSFHCESNTMTSDSSLCLDNTLLLSWHDQRVGSEMDVRAEEVTHKQFQHELKRYTKKYGSRTTDKKSGGGVPAPPVHIRPSISTSLSALSSSFPVDYTEDGSCRSIYKSVQVSPYIEIFLLDIRQGYIMKDQAKWLKEKLLSSISPWKIIVSGVPVATKPVQDDFVGQNNKDDDVNTKGVSYGNNNSRSRSRVSTVMSLPLNQQSDDASSVDDIINEVTNGQNESNDVTSSKNEKNDVDEWGRSKNNLDYILFSVQRSLEKKKQLVYDTKSTDVDDGTVTSQSATDNVTIDTNEGLYPSNTFLVESGIIIISSYSQATNVTTNSTYSSEPYVAILDPSESGKSFCPEIHMGQCVNSSINNNNEININTVSTSRRTIVPNMGVNFINFDDDEEESSKVGNRRSDGSHSKATNNFHCTTKLLSENALEINLLKSSNSVKGEDIVVFSKVFHNPNI